LEGTALAEVQSDIGRYYGSSHVVLRAAEKAGGKAEVFVSDRVTRLISPGVSEFKAEGFDAKNVFSALEAQVDADLLLIDPFAQVPQE